MLRSSKVPETEVEPTLSIVLGASLLIPIHYGTFHNPPIYFETDNVEGRLLSFAKKENINVKLIQHQEKLEL
ncbi:MAG: hypothetical protein Q8934_16190 [Bacillota bacterium]|nr:hypothetical protein [Bacillota bacterium]